MYGLISFFHIAVYHAGVTADDADILCRRMGILLCTLADLDSLNEQPQKIGSQFSDGPESLDLFNEVLRVCR